VWGGNLKVGVAKASKDTEVIVTRSTVEVRYGTSSLIEDEGRQFSKCVATARASTQYGGGMDAWMRSARTELLRVRRTRSALPFWGEVYGQESRNKIPLATRCDMVDLLTNSVPLLA